MRVLRVMQAGCLHHPPLTPQRGCTTAERTRAGERAQQRALSLVHRDRRDTVNAAGQRLLLGLCVLVCRSVHQRIGVTIKQNVGALMLVGVVEHLRQSRTF